VKKIVILILLISFYNFAYSQVKLDTSNTFILFPKERVFSQINLDPLSCKVYGGLHLIYENGKNNDGVFIPVNLGFSKPFFTYKLDKIKFEIGLEACSFTQFEIEHVEGNTYVGGLFNNDYKASAYISAFYKELSYRVRLFHISSHLGDDYMIRNEDFARNDKSVNYEQIDLTILKKVKFIEYYSGIGYIITPNAFRERFSFQAGFQFFKDSEKLFHLIGGTDIKLFEQNDFYPNIRSAIGTKISHSDSKFGLCLQVELYHGHIPYSTQEYRKITWIGVGSYLDI